MGLKWMWAWGLFMFISIEGWLSHGCWETERVALLQLKHIFNDPNNLRNWDHGEKNLDCCKWERVGCDNITSRVIKLNFSYTRNSWGKWHLNASLFSAFEKLVSLDLASNLIAGFVENEGLDKLSKLSNLEELNLGANMFNNSILSSLAVVSSLKLLKLNDNKLKGIVNVSGLDSLYNLEYLDMSNNTIDKFLFPKGLIRRLKTLYLQNIVSTHDGTTLKLQSLRAFSSLKTLDLSNNELNESSTTTDLPNFKNLKHLFMDGTSLDVTFLQIIGLMTSLEVLSLSNCGLKGNLSHQEGGILPKFLSSIHDLREVDLSQNNLNGEFPNWLLENKANLEYLDLSSNLLGRCFLLPSHSHLNLKILDVSNNSFHGYISKEIGTYLPSLVTLNLSRNCFDGRIPSSIGDMSSLEILDLSHNQLSGKIPEHLAEGCISLQLLVLSNNNIQGKIFSTNFNLRNLWRLQLDGNNFIGNIPDSLANASNLVGLYLSDNQLVGSIPSWLGNMSSLKDIIMPNNHLQGTIPLEFCRLNNLEVLNLAENNISGSLPSCFNSSSITQVHLSKNRLHGQLKDAFYNCSSLVTLDLSYNCLDGSIPTWIDRFSNLTYLILSNNNLEGEVPTQLCQMNQLRLIDLSHNNLCGHIPSCLDVTALHDNGIERLRVSKTSTFLSPPQPPGGPPMRKEEIIEFTTKNISYFYQGKVLSYMCGIDLSCNKLTGLIPPEIGNLTRIHTLNVSHNNLIGPIPMTFSQLTQIESLDLSYNNLNGEIPPQLVELYALSFFSVAYNNLSGKIPKNIAQFSTFEEKSYEGNPFLCGPPLPKSCDTIGPPSFMPRASTHGDDNNFIDMDIFYISFVVSFVTAFSGISITLYVNSYPWMSWLKCK